MNWRPFHSTAASARASPAGIHKSYLGCEAYSTGCSCARFDQMKK
jgi:hypothetical protein